MGRETKLVFQIELETRVCRGTGRGSLELDGDREEKICNSCDDK